LVGTDPLFLRLSEMSEEFCASYFADREAVERGMSERASNQRVAAVHAEMADRYEALALVFGAKREAEPPTPQ
jgi:hypothetical protein